MRFVTNSTFSFSPSYLILKLYVTSKTDLELLSTFQPTSTHPTTKTYISPQDYYIIFQTGSSELHTNVTRSGNLFKTPISTHWANFTQLLLFTGCLLCQNVRSIRAGTLSLVFFTVSLGKQHANPNTDRQVDGRMDGWMDGYRFQRSLTEKSLLSIGLAVNIKFCLKNYKNVRKYQTEN